MGNACGKASRNDGVVDTEEKKPNSPTLSDWQGADARATAYNVDAQAREDLILLHEAARGRQNQEPKSGSSLDINLTARTAIAAAPMDLDLTFRAYSSPKDPAMADFLFDALDDNFVFDVIDDETKREFVTAMQKEVVKEGQWVMHQGDIGDFFYVVAEGEVAYFVEQGLEPGDISSTRMLAEGEMPSQASVGNTAKGGTFGELALLYRQARAVSVRATTALTLFKIDQNTFRQLLMAKKVQGRDDVMKLLKDSSIFQDLGNSELKKLANAFTLIAYDEGERIVNKGDVGNILYIVKSGEVKLHNIGHGLSKFEDQFLKEGGYFGERALFESEHRGRAANVTAVTECSLFAISKETCEQIIGPIEQAIMYASHSRFLSCIPSLSGLEPAEINRCVKFLKEEHFKKNEKIIAQGKLYVIEEGEALMMHKHGIANGDKEGETALVRLKEGDYFGDIWSDDIQDERGTQMNENTINVESDLVCLTLSSSDIKTVVGELALGQMERQIKMEMVSMVKSKKFASRNTMKLSEVKRIRILGEGAFGKVWLVTPNEAPPSPIKPKIYALKVISKRQLIQVKLVAGVLREKNVMESIKHPFLLNLVQTFQDENYVYLMLNLIQGGELFDLLYDNNGTITTNAEWTKSTYWKSFGREDDKTLIQGKGVGARRAVFYSACVIEAFAHLRNRRIVYRDLKPENVMINSSGYCVVVDMGFAKVVLDKTYTMCGTPEYIAPEVILNMGHGHAADHWSIGCLLFELIVGHTPFYNVKAMDHINLMKRIVKADYKYPEFCSQLSPNSQGLDKTLFGWKDLTNQLLQNNAAERLGNLQGGIDDILSHDWFTNVDFHEFRYQKVPAPWLPVVKNPLDSSNNKNTGLDDPEESFPKKMTDDDQDKFKNF